MRLVIAGFSGEAFQSTGFDNEGTGRGYFGCKADCKCLRSEPSRRPLSPINYCK